MIVNILYESARDLFSRPYPYLVVVGEKEKDKPRFGGSSEKLENQIQIKVTDT